MYALCHVKLKERNGGPLVCYTCFEPERTDDDSETFTWRALPGGEIWQAARRWVCPLVRMMGHRRNRYPSWHSHWIDRVRCRFELCSQKRGRAGGDQQRTGPFLVIRRSRCWQFANSGDAAMR